MTLKTLAAAGLAVAFAWPAVDAYAAQPYQDYNKRIEGSQKITALTDELMGDSVSLYNGATEFVVTDIDLPGNNALPVQLSRRFSVEIFPVGSGSNPNSNYLGIGNWDVEVPYISTMWAQGPWPATRCSAQPMPNVPPPLDQLDFWHGMSAHLPGAGDRKLLSLTGANDVPRPTDGVTRHWTTRERDMISCIPMQSGLAGEGFLLQTGDGLKYYFNVATSRFAGSMTYNAGESISGTVSRVKYYLLASKVEDRFGNTVVYSYNADGYPETIQSSDGRKITLVYSGVRLTSATAVHTDPADNRTWTYAYGTSGDNAGMLTSVTRPDASKWQYTHVGTLYPNDGGVWDGGSGGPNCNVKPPAVLAGFQITATHPSGAVGTFELGNLRQPRSGVHHSACLQRIINGTVTYKLLIPNYFDVMALHTKTISGPGLAARTWTYEYPFGSVALWGSGAPNYPCGSCPAEKVVTVNEPDGTVKRYRYGFLYAVNEGRLLGTTTLDAGGTVRRVETTEYVSEAEAPSQTFYGTRGIYGVGFGMDEPSTLAIRPVIARMITQDGTDFIWAVAQGCNGAGVFCFDEFARPTKVIKTSLAAATGDVVRPSGVPGLSAPESSLTGNYSVTWTTVPFANRYELQERLGSGSWATIQNGAGISKAFTSKANGTWSYQVRACNALGCAGWSAVRTVEVQVPPSAAPTLIAPDTNTTGSYTVSWSTVARATRYEAGQNANGSGWGALYNGAGTSASRSGMLSGTYQYRVRACNTGGCGPYSAVVTTVVNRTSPVPPAPLNLTAPAQVEPFTAFNVSWGASSGATSYRLERSRNGGAWILAYEGTERITSQTLGLGSYLYRVQACNSGGCGLYSSGASVLVKAEALVADEVDGE